MTISGTFGVTGTAGAGTFAFSSSGLDSIRRRSYCSATSAVLTTTSGAFFGDSNTSWYSAATSAVLTVTSRGGDGRDSVSGTAGRIFSGFAAVWVFMGGNSFPLDTGLSDGLSTLKLSIVLDLGLAFSSVEPLFVLIHGSLVFAEFAETPSLDFGLASPSSMLFLTSVPKELLACGMEP